MKNNDWFAAKERQTADGCWVEVTSFRLQVSRCRVQVAGYRKAVPHWSL